jgi:hypothetical protein
MLGSISASTNDCSDNNVHNSRELFSCGEVFVYTKDIHKGNAGSGAGFESIQ